jgi:hypothetical protein
MNPAELAALCVSLTAGKTKLEILPVERLATPDERRLSVAGHHQWRESITSQPRDFDPIDELVEEIRKVEFKGKGTR